MSVKNLLLDAKNITIDDILQEDKVEEKKKKAAERRVPKTYTKEEKDEMLRDYLIVKKDEWYLTPLDSHLRYMKKDGTFVAGGYLKRKWKREEKIYFSIAKSPYTEEKKWVVELTTNVDILYKKLNEGSRMEVELIKKSLISMDNRIKLIENNASTSQRRNSTEIRAELELLRKENEELKLQNERLKGSLKKTNSVVSQIAKYVSKKKK